LSFGLRAVGVATTVRYQNPVLPGFYPDPSVCRVESEFFLVTSTFEYFPGVPIFRSENLVDWEQLGHCLASTSQVDLTDCPSSKGVYAPTLRHHAGTYYVVTTNMNLGYGAHFLVTAQDPAGPWSEPIELSQYGIDPSLFFDDDGRCYLTTNGKEDAPFGLGIYQSEIDPATGRRLTEPRFLWPGTGGMAPEAPHLYKRNGEYFLLIAEGGTSYGHMVTLARGPRPYGPFEPAPHNPLLSHRSLGSPIAAVGHADLVEAQDGSWWALCLGIRPRFRAGAGAHHLGREVFLAPVSWDTAGFPHINQGRPLELSMTVSGLPGRVAPERRCDAWLRDDFDGQKLGLAWNFIRHLDAGAWSLSERPSFLRLRGGPLGLSAVGQVSFVGLRQRHFACRFTAQLSFCPAEEGAEAGVAIRMNEAYHYQVGVRRAGGGLRVFVRRVLGGHVELVAERPLPSCVITLEVLAEPERYWLKAFVGGEGAAPVLSVPAETRLLSSEVAGTFTGVYLGLYATGNGRPVSSPADFDWVEYEPMAP
jgi:xylan 1,4-beta-xylosidase